MTLRRIGCALYMPFIAPYRSPLRPYNRAYAYRGLTAFASLMWTPVGGELLFKLLQGADKSLGSESANGIYST